MASVGAPSSVSNSFFLIDIGDKKLLKISSEAARQSVVLGELVEKLGADPSNNVLSMSERKLDEDAMRKVIDWCEHHKAEAPMTSPEDLSSDVSEWDRVFLASLPNEQLYALILAAECLDIPRLLAGACNTVAMMANGKSPEQLRALFQILADEEDV